MLLNINKNNVIKYIGIDPGSHFTGICYGEYDVFSFKIVSLNTLLIKTSVYTNMDIADTPYGYNDYWYRGEGLYNQIYDLCLNIQPDIVGCETPFYYELRPTAYGPLVSMLTMIQKAVYDYNPYTIWRSLSPLSIKHHLKVKSIKDKEAVKEALYLKLEGYDLECITEHEIDAIGCVITLLDEIKDNKGVY